MAEAGGHQAEKEVSLVRANVKDALLAEIEQNLKNGHEAMREDGVRKRRDKRVEQTRLRIQTFDEWAKHLPLHRSLTVEEIKALSPYAARWHCATLAKGLFSAFFGIGCGTVPLAVSIWLTLMASPIFGILAGAIGIAEFILFLVWVCTEGECCKFLSNFFVNTCGKRIIDPLLFLLRGFYRHDRRYGYYRRSCTTEEEKELAEFFYGKE